MTMSPFPFQQKLPRTLHPKVKRYLNKPKMQILRLRYSAIGSSILNSMMTRNRHELRKREMPFLHEPAAAGTSGNVRLKRPMETAVLACFPSTKTAEGNE